MSRRALVALAVVAVSACVPGTGAAHDAAQPATVIQREKRLACIGGRTVCTFPLGMSFVSACYRTTGRTPGELERGLSPAGRLSRDGHLEASDGLTLAWSGTGKGTMTSGVGHGTWTASSIPGSCSKGARSAHGTYRSIVRATATTVTITYTLLGFPTNGSRAPPAPTSSTRMTAGT